MTDAFPAAPPLALVIFDCDGVLIDSEPISLATLTLGLNGIGLAIDIDAVRERFAGTSMTSIMERVAREDGITAPNGFVERVKAETLAAFEAELTAMAGIAEAVGLLHLPFCVASSSDPVRLRHSSASPACCRCSRAASSPPRRWRAESRSRICSSSPPNGWASRRQIAS